MGLNQSAKMNPLLGNWTWFIQVHFTCPPSCMRDSTCDLSTNVDLIHLAAFWRI